MDYVYSENLAKSVEIPTGGIISKTIASDEYTRTILFGFDTGEELTEHTASVPATIFIVSGEADLTLGGDKKVAAAGTWAHMPAQMAHSVYAKTPVVMLLIMGNAKRS